jgi:HD-GYP domain-containing protein (c-di-GMP phosphodiesterase class II)/DNA-binding CsgD family transcriptional regulator
MQPEGPWQPAGDRVGEVRTIDLLGALSLAADMALGLPAGHAVRATYIGMRIAEVLGLSQRDRSDLFYAELMMDAGCTAWASQVAATILGDDVTARRQLFFFSDYGDPRDVVRWLARYMAAGERTATRLRRTVDFAVHGRRFMMEGMHNTSEVAARIAGRLDRSPGVQQALRFVFERWDGSGPNGRRAESIPLISRIVYASIFLEVFHQTEGRNAAVALARDRRGDSLDPGVVDAFLRLAADEPFWQGLEDESIWSLVCALEPESPSRSFSADRLDDAAAAFGDFADLKSFYTAGHARRVAALAERIAARLRLPPAEVVAIRRSALLHDIGLVGVPSFVLHKPESRLSDAEWETLRLHPYYGERILGRVPAFAALCPIVAAHHERPDGRGYHRGLTLDAIPVGARVVRVAERFDELTHVGPERGANAAEDALVAMGRDAGAGFWSDAVAALHEVHPTDHPERPLAPPREAAPPPAPRRPPWPASLTDREVEVLRTLATGASRRAMAAALSVSEHTIRHHLEHIYGKIEVRTRVEATLFAVEHGLLP